MNYEITIMRIEKKDLPVRVHAWVNRILNPYGELVGQIRLQDEPNLKYDYCPENNSFIVSFNVQFFDFITAMDTWPSDEWEVTSAIVIVETVTFNFRPKSRMEVAL